MDSQRRQRAKRRRKSRRTRPTQPAESSRVVLGYDEAARGSGTQGSDQSTGPAPWLTSEALVRLNGREPKKPRDADRGEG